MRLIGTTQPLSSRRLLSSLVAVVTVLVLKEMMMAALAKRQRRQQQWNACTTTTTITTAAAATAAAMVAFSSSRVSAFSSQRLWGRLFSTQSINYHSHNRRHSTMMHLGPDRSKSYLHYQAKSSSSSSSPSPSSTSKRMIGMIPTNSFHTGHNTSKGTGSGTIRLFASHQHGDNSNSNGNNNIDIRASETQRQREKENYEEEEEEVVLLSDGASNTRVKLLREQLTTIGIDANRLYEATLISLKDPTLGYDDTFGKSAIRAYRSFIFPKKAIVSSGSDDDSIHADEAQSTLLLEAAAGRCARQIDFLIKRHHSHKTEWVRHHDTTMEEDDGDDGDKDGSSIKRRQVFPLILILDNIRSAFNVGSLYRTADACGCQLVVTCGITPHPYGNGADKLAKSALGAELLVPSMHFKTTQQAIAYVREELTDFAIVGMETTEQSMLYTNIEYTAENQMDKVALLLGNEVTGVDTAIMPDLDTIVEIPTFGAKNSLNVAACAPVVLYEILRQWKK